MARFLGQGAAAGIADEQSMKKSVLVATTGSNIDLASAPATIDGVDPESKRVLVKDQTDPIENGIYIHNGTGNAMTRTLDADEDTEIACGLRVFVREGTANEDTQWDMTSDSVTIGVDDIDFVQFGGGIMGTVTNRVLSMGLTGNLLQDSNLSQTAGGDLQVSKRIIDLRSDSGESILRWQNSGNTFHMDLRSANPQFAANQLARWHNRSGFLQMTSVQTVAQFTAGANVILVSAPVVFISSDAASGRDFSFASKGGGSIVEDGDEITVVFDSGAGTEASILTTAPAHATKNDGDLRFKRCSSCRFTYNAAVWYQSSELVHHRPLGAVTVTGTSYTADSNEHEILVDDDTAGSDVTITLPPVVDFEKITIKKLGTTADVIIATPGAETIDGAASETITVQYDARNLFTDLTNYFLK